MIILYSIDFYKYLIVLHSTFQGADVNYGKHEYNYSSLHFGALSGNAEVCQTLMMAGVKVDARNSIGRTAAQMAAFVGNYHVVAIINNFIPKSSVDYFTKSKALDAAPMLPLALGEQFHKFIMEVNLNPVRVALNLYRSSGLADHLDKVKSVLEAMSEKEMNKGSDNDEILSFKLHYLSYLVGEINDIRQRHIASKEPKKEENSEEKKVDFVELFSRKLLKPGKDGVTLEYQDSFLKEGVRKFPFRQCVIFRQAVSTLAQKDSPSTLCVIESAINGQRGFVNTVPYCITCGEEKPAKKCSKCKSVQYCDRECQRLHWFIHKKACTRLASAPISTSAALTQRKIDTADLSQHLQDLVTG